MDLVEREVVHGTKDVEQGRVHRLVVLLKAAAYADQPAVQAGQIRVVIKEAV